MKTRDDADLLVRSWFAETATAGSPDYASDVMALVDRVPQQRRGAWLRAPWKPGPAEAPVMRAGLALAAVGLLLLALVGTLLLAGARPKPPPFKLQGIVPVTGTVNATFLSADADGIWVTGDREAIHVDPVTNELSRIPVPLTDTNFTGVVAGAGSLWVADYDGHQVTRLDPATGTVQARIYVLNPVALTWQEGLWVLRNKGGGLVRIDPSTNAIDLDIPSVTAYALTPGTLWYIESAQPDAWLVEADPATGAVRSRTPVPYEVAGSMSVDASGNVYLWRRGITRSQVAVIDAKTHVVSEVFNLMHNLIGGITAVGGSMWGATAPGEDGHSRLVELGPKGATGREEVLAPGLDPDNPIVAFGSLWIPFDSHAALYRYPADALAP